MSARMQHLISRLKVYRALAAMEPKLFLAYSTWVWMELFVQVVAMTVFVYFWRAVYTNHATLGGLSFDQTLNYILLAQILAPVMATQLIYIFGYGMQEGRIGIELLRPVDFQARYYVESLADMVTALLLKAPLTILAVAVFGLRLPSDWRIWAAFAVALLLGHAVIFCFDWILACLAFYTTEVWGWSYLRYAIGRFFSGALLPLNLMPPWLMTLTLLLPFSQSLYAPVSLLSGITPLAQAPQVWLLQALWFVGLLAASRWVFQRAVRAVTVQGG